MKQENVYKIVGICGGTPNSVDAIGAGYYIAKGRGPYPYRLGYPEHSAQVWESSWERDTHHKFEFAFATTFNEDVPYVFYIREAFFDLDLSVLIPNFLERLESLFLYKSGFYLYNASQEDINLFRSQYTLQCLQGWIHHKEFTYDMLEAVRQSLRLAKGPFRRNLEELRWKLWDRLGMDEKLTCYWELFNTTPTGLPGGDLESFKRYVRELEI